MSSEQPECPAREPYGVEVSAGKKYYWCACGRSKQQPFCDGSHAGTSFVPLEHTAERDGTLWFCGCKRTNKQPLCDGSHNKL
ncbi:MAG: CDGSH iron-sulfur domain-containing protein [Pseudomonadota bacterium]